MKDVALLLGVLIILCGVGWYLFNSIEMAEAPLQSDGEQISEEPSPLSPYATTTPAPNAPNSPSSVTTFDGCVAAGNPVMESYPRQCRHNGQLFVEVLVMPPQEPVACTMDAKICPDGSAVGRTGPNCEFSPCPGEGAPPSGGGAIMCSPESKLAEACNRMYAPVCGLVEVQCVTTPCNPVPETFSNACTACAQGNVISYTEGQCTLQ